MSLFGSSTASKSAARGFSEGVRSTAYGSNKVSNACTEKVMSSSAHAEAKWLSLKDKSKKVCDIQVERKLRKMDMYKGYDNDEMAKKIIELTDVEAIQCNFSHLVDNLLLEAIDIASNDKKDKIDQDNVDEFRDTKENEKYRCMEVAKIPIRVFQRDIEGIEPQSLICSVGNFLCTDYGAQHVGLIVGDIVLEWGQENIVDSLKLDKVPPNNAIYEATIPTDRRAPHKDLPLKTVAEEADDLFTLTSEKKLNFEELANVIARYNAKYYYAKLSRNCQGFVRDALKALGIENKPTPAAPSQQLQEAQAKKSKNIPSSFARHEDLDAYLMKQSREWFEKLDAESLEYLQYSYVFTFPR